MEKRIQEAADLLGARLGIAPEIGLITGTGLGGLTGRMQIEARLPYETIPHFPRSALPGHEGNLVAGRLGGRSLLAMEGRFHAYEGHSPREVTFPVRVMARLGVRTLLISSAAGGLNPLFSPGDLMLVTDHINLTGWNPLTGANLDSFGPRFPDMSAVYDRSLRGLARQEALESGILLREGVYVGILGPSLETPAETRFLRMIGADAVGMSTVPEAIVGVHCGLRILGIVVVTNVNLPDCMRPTSIEEVIEVAGRAGESLSRLWERIISRIPA
ncbi:MAG: purine-nucleoside phosphorylase [Deltaproteobacteria bacterium]|nr:purine-nucleoside phosphorylase [Deltaproteobacteria bacterium]